MKKILLIATLAFVVIFLFPSNVLAQAKPKTIVKLPVFMAGDVQTIDKPIEGDLMIAGKEIKIVSDVNGDAYVAGGDVEISGDINGNLIVAGGTVKVSGKISKNLIMAGGEVVVSDLATVDGYVLAGGNKLDLFGKFLGPVKVGARDLVIGDKAVINGNLEADVNKYDISPTSKIIGEKKIQIHEIKQPEKQSDVLFKFALGRKIFSFLSKLILLLVLVKLLGEKIINLNIKNSFWSNIGWGLIMLVVTPFLMLILAATFIGMSLSGIILSFYLVSLSLSGIVASIITGNYFYQKGYLKTNNLYIQGFVGLLALRLLTYIPYVGLLVKFIILLFGLGFIFKGIKTYFSNK